MPDATPAPLAFPFPEPPRPGELCELRPGLYWLRLPLPFRLNHVNIYLLEDGDGLTAIDTGIGDATTIAMWEALLAGPLAARPLRRVIATHAHPDHIGMAGWLCERLGIDLLTSQTEYLICLTIQLDPDALSGEHYRRFYAQHGLDPATTALMLTNGHRYLRMITGLPRSFHRLVAGETRQIGRRRFSVLSGGGHAPEQIMLHCAEEQLLLAADQVLARISPNVSVQAIDPAGDPLGIYLRSLQDLKRDIPAGTLVLPGHDIPFTGLWTRIDQLAAHHQSRCGLVLAACRERPQTAADLVPLVFGRAIEAPHQMGFAFSEALAHANRLLREGRLRLHDGHFHPVTDLQPT